MLKNTGSFGPWNFPSLESFKFNATVTDTINKDLVLSFHAILGSVLANRNNAQSDNIYK